MAAQPLFVSSGDLIADRRYRWALDYLKQGDPAAAAEVLEQVVETAPGFATAWFALAVIREQLGRHQAAVSAFRAACDADPEDYHGARLHLSRLGASSATPSMTATYVRRLFDQHAPDFDRSLLEQLQYRGPAVLLDAIRDATGPALGFDAVLDLGCGTGLAGEAIRPHCKHLAGVDISAAMVERARDKKLYDVLAVGELSEFLVSATARYDLVLAADVFVYCADLAPICASVARILAPGGLFAFTVEFHGGADAVLQPTLRYAHGEPHVRSAIGTAGLGLRRLDPVSTRKEKGEWMPGLVAVAMAPPAAIA